MSMMPEATGTDTVDAVLDVLRPVPTGRVVLMFDPDANADDRRRIIASEAGKALGRFEIEIAGAREHRGTAPRSGGSNVLVFDRLGVAVFEFDQANGAQAASIAGNLGSVDGIASARPEYFVYAMDVWRDTSESTWGLKATGAVTSEFTGKGVKVAVLDTGFSFDHFDFRDRDIEFRDFVKENGDAVDRQGHGTHCAGTLIGPRDRRSDMPNYGCAPDASLYVAKVLNDRGSGTERDIFDGIEWALDEGCDVISMSLGRPVQPGTPHDPLYERLGQSALASGSLIVAAAGNDSSRISDFIAPVSIPANAPSIMAVAALDADLSVSWFSNGGVNPAAAGVDIAAPGMRVLSAGLVERPYVHLDGTSMATPHVAGIAALYAESNRNLRGKALWDELVRNAMPINGSKARDVGAGLVQAPKLMNIPIV